MLSWVPSVLLFVKMCLVAFQNLVLGEGVGEGKVISKWGLCLLFMELPYIKDGFHQSNSFCKLPSHFSVTNSAIQRPLLWPMQATCVGQVL